MNKMNVSLLYNTPLWIGAMGVRRCWASEAHSDSVRCFDGTTVTGEADKEIIERVGNKNKHSSVLRHLTYTFDISGISTKTVMAFTRHKAGVDFSIQSTRYTIKKRKGSLSYTQTPNARINELMEWIEEIINIAISEGHSNDDISMLLPQSYQYSCIVTMNAQAIQHFLTLRTDKSAHWDIQELANELYNALPDDHKYLFKDFLIEH